MPLTIKGLQKTTLVDYPDKVACTIFLPRCNFRCGFCYNKDLVLEEETLQTISEEEILNFLKEKKQWLDGVVFTGGEPLLHKELPDFIKKVKQLNLLVKVDTNGTNPEMLKQLIDNKLVDYIAMDIKAPLEKYEDITKTKVNKENIKKSIDLLKNTNSELRLTVVPTLHKKEDIEAIGKWLKGNKKLFLQQFQPNEKMIDKTLLKVKPYSKETLAQFKDILKNYIKEVKIRD